jgi:hypothetical protein
MRSARAPRYPRSDRIVLRFGAVLIADDAIFGERRLEATTSGEMDVAFASGVDSSSQRATVRVHGGKQTLYRSDQWRQARWWWFFHVDQRQHNELKKVSLTQACSVIELVFEE